MREAYARLANVYDAKWAFYVEASVRETLSRLALFPGDRVLEVGCGTGALLRKISETGADLELHGADPVPEMLAIARKRLPESVRLQEAWAEALPYPDGGLDVVVSCNMFHYIREPEKALAEMRRVLRPGGRLVVTDWCDDYLACKLCDWYLKLADPAHFRMYGSAELKGLLGRAGFLEISLDRYKISPLWGLMTARTKK